MQCDGTGKITVAGLLGAFKADGFLGKTASGQGTGQKFSESLFGKVGRRHDKEAVESTAYLPEMFLNFTRGACRGKSLRKQNGYELIQSFRLLRGTKVRAHQR